MAPQTLLIIGIHREELAFGAAVAAVVDRGRIDVLTIPDGLAGQRPRADQRLRYQAVHEALYRQLPSHVRPQHRLVVDLHTGIDERAPCADIYTSDPARVAGLLARADTPVAAPRLIALGNSTDGPTAQTVIPPEIWRHPRFLYVGLEIYVPASGTVRDVDVEYARTLVDALAMHGVSRVATREGAANRV